MTKEEFVKKYSTNRQGTDSLKWDALDVRFGDPDLISMWVADMEFRTCEGITDALVERCKHGIFGYSYVPDEYYKIVSDWMEKHHNWPIQKEWVRFSNGVVVSIYWIVNCFTKPGDACIILTPVYYPFHHAVKDNGRKLVTCDLINTNGYFTIDYDAFEKAIVDNGVKLFIQCSPHNPVSRVWTEEELDQVMAICKRHGVLVVSDEIHQDIVVSDKKQIPAAIVSGGRYTDNLVVVSAASKTFNLAGLLHSHIIIPDANIRKEYDAYAKTVNQIETNILGVAATKSGYESGEEWLKGMLEVVKENFAYLKEGLAKAAPKVVVTPLEATYLVFLDFRPYVKPGDIRDFIQNRCRLAVDYGEWFGTNFKGFVRLNMATDPQYVHAAVENIGREIAKL